SRDAQGLTDEQRFFLAYAQSWRSKMRPELLRVLLATDGHAPDQYRADTVRNIDAWYQAFNIQPARKLYLAPEARVRVWARLLQKSLWPHEEISCEAATRAKPRARLCEPWVTARKNFRSRGAANRVNDIPRWDFLIAK